MTASEVSVAAGSATAFVLVSGPFTGGRVWSEVAARLGAAGCEVHAVTLTGTGGDSGAGAVPAGPGTDLETHIADVLRLVDAAVAPQVVLVGHDYGIHPVLGAADRRPERVARVVYLDAGLPQDGDVALALVPDRTVHELLAAEEGGDAPVPPPAPDGWQRWGSTAGLDAGQLALLSELSAPQARGVFTRPLRLTGGLAAVPTSGILCTASGMTIDSVQALVAVGPPQIRALADPRVGFFELATGHWPMLSCPGELAEVLLRAAAGEGRRLVPPAADEVPYGRRGFLLEVPERPRVRAGRVDLHLPEGAGPHPAVLFVHGGPVVPDARPTPRESEFFVGYARYAASLGVVGATVDHRLFGLADFGRAAADVAEAVEVLRADPRVDGDRVALWFFSGGGLLTTDWLAAPPAWLRCVAANYPVLAPLPGWQTLEPRFRPVEAVRGAGRLPIVLTRAGLEIPEMAATVESFVVAAEEAGAALELVDVPNGHHGFEALERTEESREAVARAAHAVLGHLRA